MAFSILLPMFIMVCLASLLSLILCIDHDELEKHPVENNILDQEPKMSTPKTTHTLRSVNNSTDMTCLSPESVILSRSLTNSPNNTISRGLHCRPNPPPYVRPKNKPNF